MMAKNPDARFQSFLSLRKGLEGARDNVASSRRDEAALAGGEKRSVWPEDGLRP